jgi:hypothetical protein
LVHHADDPHALRDVVVRVRNETVENKDRRLHETA